MVSLARFFRPFRFYVHTFLSAETFPKSKLRVFKLIVLGFQNDQNQFHVKLEWQKDRDLLFFRQIEINAQKTNFYVKRGVFFMYHYIRLYFSLTF